MFMVLLQLWPTMLEMTCTDSVTDADPTRALSTSDKFLPRLTFGLVAISMTSSTGTSTTRSNTTFGRASQCYLTRGHSLWSRHSARSTAFLTSKKMCSWEWRKQWISWRERQVWNGFQRSTRGNFLRWMPLPRHQRRIERLFCCLTSAWRLSNSRYCPLLWIDCFPAK